MCLTDINWSACVNSVTSDDNANKKNPRKWPKSVVEWGRKWMITYNATETNLFPFNNYKNLLNHRLPWQHHIREPIFQTPRPNIHMQHELGQIHWEHCKYYCKKCFPSTVLENCLHQRGFHIVTKPQVAHASSIVVTSGLAHLLLVSHS